MKIRFENILEKKQYQGLYNVTVLVSLGLACYLNPVSLTGILV